MRARFSCCCRASCLFGAFVASCVLHLFRTSGDLLTGYGSSTVIGSLQMQFAVSGFCLSPLPKMLTKDTLSVERGRSSSEARLCAGGGCRPTGHASKGRRLATFDTTGDIKESRYTKNTIYALLYSTYADVGTVTWSGGKPFEFTFNTWGIAPSPYPPSDPFRHGKASYHWLVMQKAVAAYRAKLGRPITVVEIGSGSCRRSKALLHR